MINARDLVRIVRVMLTGVGLVGAPFVSAPISAAAQDVNIIVSSTSPITELSAEEAQQIFLARRLRWGNQRIGVAVNMGERSVYERLVRRFTGDTTRAFGLMWLEAAFQRAAPDPRIAMNEEEMIRLVASTPGLVGYTLETEPPESVRVVYRLQLLRP